MLFVIDVGVGVRPWVFDVIKSMFKPAGRRHLFLIGNPTDTSSQMYAEELATGPDGGPSWSWQTMAAPDHPNLAAELEGRPPPFPAAVSLAQFQAWLADWAEPIDARDAVPATDLQWPPEWWRKKHKPADPPRWFRPGPLMEARALGRWPSQGTYGVWSDAAWQSAVTTPRPVLWGGAQLPEVGCDGARHGDDCTAIAVRLGCCLLTVERHNGWDVLRIAHRLKELCKNLAGRANAERPDTARPLSPQDIPVKIDGDTGASTSSGWARPTATAGCRCAPRARPGSRPSTPTAAASCGSAWRSWRSRGISTSAVWRRRRWPVCGSRRWRRPGRRTRPGASSSPRRGPRPACAAAAPTRWTG
jgi:hypothetical protein